MANIEESKKIAGVQHVSLTPFGDERGRFVETFRRDWFPDRHWDRLQVNVSYSVPGVLRGLHYHLRQIDYWFVAKGSVRVGLCDLRRSSTTRLATETFEMSHKNSTGLFIPVGVAHGFMTLEEVVLTYLVDNYYDGTDENGVAWNDPDIGMNWGTTSPQLSPRDAANRMLREIPGEEIPD